MKLRASTLLKIELIYVLLIKFFIDTFGLPNSMWYFCDLINLSVMILFGKPFVSRIRGAKMRFFQSFFVVFVIITIIGLIINGQSILLYIWGMRNIARMFVFWVGCIAFWNKDDVYQAIKMLYGIFVINFILSIFQFFVQHISGDNLGGVFGTKGASNSFTLNFLVIISVLSFILYLNKTMDLTRLVLYIGMAIIIAPLAELKAFFVFFVIGFILVLMLQGKLSFRLFVTIIAAVLGVVLMYYFLSRYFPDSIPTFTRVGFLEYLSDSKGYGYASEGDLSRINALQRIYEMFFKGKSLRMMFGFGLGACETSSFSFLNSEFYATYEYLHYRWFFHAMTFLELGTTGIILYCIFFSRITFDCLKMLKKYKNVKGSYLVFGAVMSIYSIIIACYNSSLRIESGYLVYFCLAIPYIFSKEFLALEQYS